MPDGMYKKVGQTLVVTVAFTAVAGSLTGCRRQPDGGPVTLSLALAHLTNVAAFARTPLGQTHLVSTYDRMGGNRDWAQWNRPTIDGLYDIANLPGPGCVKRIWMTSVPAQEWLFFFDGEKEPRIRTPMTQLFGGQFPFLPPVSGYASGGFYSYMPIPFNKHLRIAVRSSAVTSQSRPYYHVNWESYPPSTSVVSFPLDLSAAESNLVRAVCAEWQATTSALRAAMAAVGPWTRRELAPGERTAWLDAEGPGVVRAFAIRFSPAVEEGAWKKARLLRELVLALYWDKAEFPSVEAPLGDFFCNAFHRRAFASLALGVVDDTFVCRFPMPFGRAARGELRNDGPTPVVLETGFRIEHKPEQKHAPRNYFHARWNGGMARGLPHNVLYAKGQGHYVGCFVSAVGMDGSWQILEGDDIMYVDGESTASWNGTGLEDYFNGAWYYHGLFDLPLHGLIEKAAERTHQYRFQLQDPIVFQKGLSMNFEFGHANKAFGYMSSVAYWYQSMPSPAGSAIPPAVSRFPPPDQLEPLTIMAQIFELERIGHWEAARNRCLEYADKLPIPTLAHILRLRAAAYEEANGHIEKALSVYERMAHDASNPEVKRQAQDLLWFRTATTNALLGIQANAHYRVFLDGKLVATGDNPLDLRVVRVGLPLGTRELAVELVPSRPNAWFSLTLRAHGTNIVTDTSWERTAMKPTTWPDTRGDAQAAWSPLEYCDMLPLMNFWHLTPNAYIYMQSGRQLARPWQGLAGGETQRPVYIRKRFSIALSDT